MLHQKNRVLRKALVNLKKFKKAMTILVLQKIKQQQLKKLIRIMTIMTQIQSK